MGSNSSSYETVTKSFLPQSLKVENGEGVLFEQLLVWAGFPLWP